MTPCASMTTPRVPGGMQMLLVTSTGRNSGRPRTTPLLFVPDAERVLMIASNGDDNRDPAWWLNLLAWPEAVVQIGPERFPAHALRAEGPEGEALFAKLIASHAPFEQYRKRTSREIPIVVLERELGAQDETRWRRRLSAPSATSVRTPVRCSQCATRAMRGSGATWHRSE